MLSVLIVNDSPPLRTALARSLARRGWRITTATNGIEALESIRTIPFDVVITDEHVPGRGLAWLWQEALALRPELQGRFVVIGSELPKPETARLVESEHFLLWPLPLDAIWNEMQNITGRAEETGRADHSPAPSRDGNRRGIRRRRKD